MCARLVHNCVSLARSLRLRIFGHSLWIRRSPYTGLPLRRLVALCAPLHTQLPQTYNNNNNKNNTAKAHTPFGALPSLALTAEAAFVHDKRSCTTAYRAAGNAHPRCARILELANVDSGII